MDGTSTTSCTIRVSQEQQFCHACRKKLLVVLLLIVSLAIIRVSIRAQVQDDSSVIRTVQRSKMDPPSRTRAYLHRSNLVNDSDPVISSPQNKNQVERERVCYNNTRMVE
uniref:Uncharacterized protein n=1 Tax=Amphimedon queenslandica TaxID=400682 RepID=A0A1X7V6A7_AMPQE